MSHGDTGEDSSLKGPSHPEYRVLKYLVPRKDYGRLNYKARIAQRIHKGLQNTDLHVPDIINRDHVSFLALVPKTMEPDDLADRKVKDITKEYRVLKYLVPRKDYGRLDYNARIAQRIYKGLQNTDLHVPDIINRDHVSFLALGPKTMEPDDLADREVKDITKEWEEQSKTIRRWVILFPENEVPFEIPEKAATLYIAEKKGKKLKENSDVQRFITLSFEIEIFAYAERAFEFLKSRPAEEVLYRREKTETKQEMFGRVKLVIRSLLARKLPEHHTSAATQSINHDELRFPSSLVIKMALETKSLQGCGIRGFFNTTDGFLVFVTKPKEDTDRKEIINSIETCCSKTKDLPDKPVITWIESMTISELAAQGDKLITNNHQVSKQGTLGCFGRRPEGGLVAITSGHFARAEQKIQLLQNQGIMVEFGKCVESTDQSNADIAIIDVNRNMVDSCDERFRGEKGEICEASVYQEDVLINWPVHKLGAVTGHTEGIVYCGGARVGEKEGIIISGVTDDDVFAKQGDSGSIVYFYDHTDVNHKTVNLLSIVSDDINISPQGTLPDGLSRRPTLTQRLNAGLATVHNITI
ncbi:uncharacterized protein LOC117340410 [Pecten maximus]|uniref:uncharacterized protein LOC117340410 n=1 Tax=Pecten maximus TaxID=6579 RepID=UPI001458D77E|nr:uncharacterized protein LOC117340410 [Pecten maximus]